MLAVMRAFVPPAPAQHRPSRTPRAVYVSGIAVLKSVLAPRLGRRKAAVRQSRLRRGPRRCRVLATVAALRKCGSCSRAHESNNRQNPMFHSGLLRRAGRSTPVASDQQISSSLRRSQKARTSSCLRLAARIAILRRNSARYAGRTTSSLGSRPRRARNRSGCQRRAEIVAIELSRNAVGQVIHFDENIAPPSSYLNDVRFSTPLTNSL